MIVSKYGFADLTYADGSVFNGTRGADPARIAAQVVSGISFLGAGVIFKNGSTVKGLTTAAGIWATAGIGLALGAGMYFIGIAVTVLVAVFQITMHRFTVGADSFTTNRFRFTAEYTADLKQELEEQLRQWDAHHTQRDQPRQRGAAVLRSVAENAEGDHPRGHKRIHGAVRTHRLGRGRDGDMSAARKRTGGGSALNLPTGFDQRFDSLRLVRELGSYSAAAQELNLSPSAIAQQIHALERELDALLFIRDGNRLLPTEVCEITADYAAQAASLRRRMELEIDVSRREVSSLVVGVSPSLEDSAVSEMLARYMQLHPKAQLRIISENSRTLIARCYAGGCSTLRIVDSPFPGNEFNSLLLDTDYLTAAVPNGSPLCGRGAHISRTAEEGKADTAPGRPGTRTLFEASLKKRG